MPFHAIRVEFKHPGCGLAGWKPASPGPDDALIAAPGSNALLFENDELRVLDVHLPPGAKDAFHTYPWPGFVYVVQPAPARRVGKEGRATLLQIPAGAEIVPVPAEGYAVENTGEVPLHLIRFELKFALPTGK